MNENEILGFDPSQLSVFNTDEPKSTGNSLIYHTRPAESKSEDGVYRCTIKVIYNPFNLKQSILEQQSYSMQDANGYFSVVSSLTDNDTSCPVFSAWKKCRYAEEGSDLWLQQAKKEDGGKALFDKRFARYCLIQVISDENQPDLEGKYMFWKLPKSVWDIINNKMKPSVESKKAPIPVMDFLFGRSIDLEVNPGPDDKAHPERRTREISYMAELSEDVVSCTNPDGSPLLNDSEQLVLDTYVEAMQKVWKSKDANDRAQMLKDINEDPNTKEFRTIYSKVLENIKSFCPNLVEHLGYREWTPEMTKRVNNWISVVLSGNNPSVEAPTAVTENIGSETTSETTTVFETQSEGTDDESDLPF